jgi:hypothetical protein
VRPLHCLAFVATLLSACSALADEARFTLVNGMNYPIRSLVMSQPNLATWGPNVLKPPSIKPGDEREVIIQGVFITCHVDMKVVLDTIADEPIWQYLNLCVLKKVKLNFDPISGVTTASYEYK